MLREMIRRWLLDEGPEPCGCGKHKNKYQAERDLRAVARASADMAAGRPWADAPTFDTPGSYRIEERRTAYTNQWLIVIYDGPTEYMLAAFLEDDYDLAHSKAVMMLEELKAKFAEKQRALHGDHPHRV